MIFYIRKKVWVYATLLTFFSTGVVAQNTARIDSLKELIEQKPGIEKYDLLVNLVREYAVSDNHQALMHARQARDLAFQFGDSSRIVNSSRMVGQLLNRLSMPKESEAILSEALPISKRISHREEVKNILNNLAIAYSIQAKYDKALDMNFQTLMLREEDQDEEGITISLNNIGFVYFKLKNYEQALEYYTQALNRLEKRQDKYFLDRLLVNIGLCYNQLFNHTKAKEHFDKAFKECGGDCSDQIMVEGNFGLGMAYYGMSQDDLAIKHFKKSYSIANKIGDERFQAENLINTARIYVRQEKTDSAAIALTQCEQISSRAGYNEILIETYMEFSSLYNRLKAHEKASAYQSKYILLKDSIYSAELIENLARIQTNYAERENIKTIATKDEIIERQRSLTILIVIIAILAALLVFVLYRSNAIKKKVNAALSEAKAIIEDQNRQLLNSNIHLNEELKEKNIDLEKANESLRRVNDELDNFIYKTSHDIRGPLASLKGMCNVALMDVHDPVALSYLRKLDITAEKLNTILTRLLIVNQINNSVLGAERIDFVSIVNDVLLLEKKKGLPPRLAIRKQIEPDIEFYSDREFVRIIFENLIDNAIKFYNDSQRVDPFVDISVRLEKNHIRITVIDNGIGISQVNPDKIFQMFSRASERSETGGIGLYITKTAVQKLGGIINLKTNPEGNTEFYILLPLATSRVLA